MSGAITGGATGGVTGAIIGSGAGGIGALPGAGTGAAGGAIGGAIVGGVSGLISAAFAPDIKGAAYGGAVAGAVSGPFGGVFGGAVKVRAAAMRIGGGAAAGSQGFGIGSRAIMEAGMARWLIEHEGSLAGTWPAIMVGGRVYVARMHDVAWQLAGRGEIQKYGMVILDAAGKVVGWLGE